MMAGRARLKVQARLRSRWKAHFMEPTDFVEGAGLSQVDVLGSSTGSCKAQALTLRRPYLVRRLVLVGATGKQT
jgi:pimeloyl-ACP methyl ester carboxylesterase